MASPVSYDLQGQGGGVVLTGGMGHFGSIRWIQVVNDAVLTNIDSDSENILGSSGLTGITLPAGLGIGGDFSNIDVLSGVVIVYFK